MAENENAIGAAAGAGGEATGETTGEATGETTGEATGETGGEAAAAGGGDATGGDATGGGEAAAPTEEITYHAVEKDGVVSAIWEMQGRKHLRTIDPRSRQGQEILRLYTAENQ
jgi:hypothetical protein